MATIAALAGAAVSAYGAYQNNKNSKAAAKGGGHVDMTTTRNPYGPATDYINAGGQAAYDTLFGTNYGPSIAGNPNAAGGAGAGAGAGGHQNVPAGYHINKAGQVVPVHNPANAAPGGAGAGAGGAPAGPSTPSTLAGKSGQSGATSSLINRMEGLPGQNAAMNNTAEQYSTNLLKGQSSNPLLSPAAIASANVGNDPRLSAFQDYLMGGLGIGGGGQGAGADGGGGGGGDLSGYFTSNGQGGAVRSGGGGYTSSIGTDAALRDLIAGKAPAGWAGMESNITDDVNSGRADIIRQLKAAGVGSGSYGSDSYDQQIGSAVAQGDRQLANQLAAARFGSYNNALTLGTQYDLGMADVAAKNYATSSSAGSAAAALAAQQRGQDLGALGNALSLGEEGRYGTAQGLGNLASLFSSDQKAALGGINDLAASRRGDLSAAGQLSLGSDQTQNSLKSAAMSANASRANVNSQIAWQQQQFYDPFTRLGDYTSILGGLYGGYGSQTEQGTDTRAGGGAGYTSPFGAALSGAAIGGQLGGLYHQTPVTTGGTGVIGSNPGATGGQAGNIW